jgi:hypothetical protein
MNHAAADGLPGGVPPQFLAGGRVVGEESTVEVAGKHQPAGGRRNGSDSHREGECTFDRP